MTSPGSWCWLCNGLAAIATKPLGWFPLGILCGGTGLSVSLLTLWPNSTWIKLGPDGIRMRVLFRDFHHRWCDINGFGLTTMHTAYSKDRLVTFWVGPKNTPHSFPSGFGKKPDHLVELLERYWQRYR